jgi:hypothetical protein
VDQAARCRGRSGLRGCGGASHPALEGHRFDGRTTETPGAGSGGLRGSNIGVIESGAGVFLQNYREPEGAGGRF